MANNKLKGIITFVLILTVLTFVGSTFGATNYVPIKYLTIPESVNSASADDTIVAIRHIEKAERVIVQDLNHTITYARGDQTIFSEGVKGSLVINDSIGDVAYDFIDIKQGIVSVNDTNLIAKIQLENIPKQLLFDKTNVTDNYFEYEWSLYIDIDNNTFTGCPFNVIGTEYAVSCMHFKFPGSIPHYDSLVNETQHNVWVYNTTDKIWEYGYNYEVYAYVDYDTNTLTMVATPFNSTILNTSKFYIVTGYNSGEQTFEWDFAPPVPTLPKSQMHVHKTEYLSTYDTYINHDKIYNFTISWSANVWEAENLDNVTYTITTSKNFTYINNWELYQNGTENSFISVPTIEGQNYTWALPLKDRIGSNINFALDSSQTIQDNPWVDMAVNTTNEGYTRVNVTFTPVVPLDWIDIYVRGNQVIDVSTYPPEFEIERLTSSYVMFASGDINQDQVYNFSVLVDKPNEVFLWLDASFGWVVESPSNIIALPVAELGCVTVKADVPVIWEHEPTLPQSVQSITIKFEEIKGFDTGEGTYPSIMGTHKGTIKPSHDITVNKLYTYPCTGTGGHSEHVWIYGNVINECALWKGYIGDWHYVYFDNPFVLEANKSYNYTIRTGSYPQIHHTDRLETDEGVITCDNFVAANGKIYYDWIPAIRLE